MNGFKLDSKDLTRFDSEYFNIAVLLHTSRNIVT